jgi:hypothetical protein
MDFLPPGEVDCDVSEVGARLYYWEDQIQPQTLCIVCEFECEENQLRCLLSMTTRGLREFLDTNGGWEQLVVGGVDLHFHQCLIGLYRMKFEISGPVVMFKSRLSYPLRRALAPLAEVTNLEEWNPDDMNNQQQQRRIVKAKRDRGLNF